MALPNRQVKGYVARQGLRPVGRSLLSPVGMRSAGRGVRATGLRAGRVGAATRGTPVRYSEGVSSGLNVAAPLVAKAIMDYGDSKATLAATDALTQLSERLSRRWLGYEDTELQPDGTEKPIFKPGYASSQGREAVSGHKQYEDDIRAIHQEIADSLDPYTQRKFLVQSMNIFTGYVNNGRNHAAAGMRSWQENVLGQEKINIGRTVNDFLSTGSVDKILPYLQDSLMQLGNKYPAFVGVKAEAVKQDILMATAKYAATQENAPDRLKLLQQTFKGEMSPDTFVKMEALRVKAISDAVKQENQRLAREEALHRKHIRDFTNALMGRIVREEDYQPTQDELRQWAGRDITFQTYNALSRAFGYDSELIRDDKPKLTSEQWYKWQHEIDMEMVDHNDIIKAEGTMTLGENKELLRRYLTNQKQKLWNKLQEMNKYVDTLAAKSDSFANTANVAVVKDYARAYMIDQLNTSPTAPLEVQSLVLRAIDATHAMDPRLRNAIHPGPIQIPFKSLVNPSEATSGITKLRVNFRSKVYYYPQSRNQVDALVTDLLRANNKKSLAELDTSFDPILKQITAYYEFYDAKNFGGSPDDSMQRVTDVAKIKGEAPLNTGREKNE